MSILFAETVEALNFRDQMKNVISLFSEEEVNEDEDLGKSRIFFC